MNQLTTHVIPRLADRMLSAEMGNALAYRSILGILTKVVVQNVSSTPSAQEIRLVLTENVLILALVYVHKMRYAM